MGRYKGEWTGKKPGIFHTAVKLAYVLSHQAQQLEDQAWALEMAIKDCRTACGRDERADAIADLQREVSKHLPNWTEE